MERKEEWVRFIESRCGMDVGCRISDVGFQEPRDTLQRHTYGFNSHTIMAELDV